MHSVYARQSRFGVIVPVVVAVVVVSVVVAVVVVGDVVWEVVPVAVAKSKVDTRPQHVHEVSAATQRLRTCVLACNRPL
jgi:hypothetical protein